MNLRFIALAFSILAISAAGNAAFAQQHALHFVNAYNQAQNKRMEADKKLIQNMEDAADWLVAYKQRKGHFPELGVEQHNAGLYLQHVLLKTNPYSMTGIMGKNEIRPCSIKWVSDSSLADTRREEWQKTPPSSWRAEPGSITIILNENYCLLWGASADQLPTYDSKANKTSLVWREFFSD